MLAENDKKFLLDIFFDDYQNIFSNAEILKTPASWKDAFFKSDTFRPAEMDELWLIKKFLEQNKVLLDTYFEDEMPRPLLTSLRTLLNTNNLKGDLTWDQKIFNKEMEAAKLPLHILHTPERQRRKIAQLDNLLKEKFKLKLYFLIEKKVKPYDIAASAVINFFLRPIDTTYFTDHEDYVVADISYLKDNGAFDLILERGYRYSAYLEYKSNANAIGPNYQPVHRTFALNGGIVEIFKALYPQLKTIISRSNLEWDQSKVLIVTEKNDTIVETERVPYFRTVCKSYMQNEIFNHVAYVFSREEKQSHGIDLLIKWSEEKTPAITKDEAISMAENFKEGSEAYGQYQKNKISVNQLKEELVRLLIEKKYAPANELTDKLLDHIAEENNFILEKCGELLHAAAVENNRGLMEKIVNQFSYMAFAGFNGCDYLIKIGAFAYPLLLEKKWEPAIRMYEMGLDVKTSLPCLADLTFYSNALWVLQKDNTGLPVNKALNEKMMAKCLPFGKENPGIYHNAAGLYAEMNEFDNALECLKKAKEYNYLAFDQMMKEVNEGENLFVTFRNFPAFVVWQTSNFEHDNFA